MIFLIGKRITNGGLVEEPAAFTWQLFLIEMKKLDNLLLDNNLFVRSNSKRLRTTTESKLLFICPDIDIKALYIRTREKITVKMPIKLIIL